MQHVTQETHQNVIWLMSADMRRAVLFLAIGVWQFALPRWLMFLVFSTLSILAYQGVLKDVF